MTATLHYLHDYVPAPDHGCTGPNCPLCRKPRSLAEVISLHSARQAAMPVQYPADVEPSGDDGRAA